MYDELNRNFMNEFLDKWDIRIRMAKKDWGTALAGGLGFLGGSLFGGGGGGGGGGRVTGQVAPSIEQLSTISPQAQGILNQLMGLAGPQIGQIGRVPPSRLGPLDPSALQQQAFGLAGGLPGQMAFDQSQITGAMAPVGEYAQRMFQQETIPAIMGGLGFQGAARSSGAADILGRAGRDVSLGLGAQFGPMQFQAQQAAFGRQMQVPGQVANIGALQRGIPGEQQAFELQRYMQQDPMRNPAIALALQTAGIPTQENIAFGGQQGYRQPSMLESFLPAAGQVLGGMFSGGYF